MAELDEFIETARGAFERRDWRAARDAFHEARSRGDLAADDYFALAEAAWWVGEIDEALRAFEAAHRHYLDAGQPRRAAMAAMFLAAHASERGDSAIGSAWVGRMQRLLRDEPEGAEHGYPLYWDVFGAMGRGDLDGALAVARRMQDLGRRFTDPNLVAIGGLGEGRALIKQGRVEDGIALLDEAMLAALSDQLHPAWTGAIYCGLMDACHELVDIRRAGEWTNATAQWCDRLSDAVLYRGICRVHRAEVLQVHGAWADAEREALQASIDLEGVHVGTVAEAHYEVGELRRLRGDLAGAEDGFRRARELGRDPQPGLALVRLAQGKAHQAALSVRAALAERAGDRLGRVRLLAGLVEISLAGGEIEAARAAAAELRGTADSMQSSGLHALAEQAYGAVLLADGNAGEALRQLRAASRRWREINARYDDARTRLLLAQAYRALGDDDAATLELDAARATFDHLGAALDLRRTEQLRGTAPRPDGLTRREVEVLQLVATGKSNREVAADLYLSEKTVARHVANIFTKLGLSSRAAATAYAFEHYLVRPTRG
jgi:DNA-binding NarL/FixJ family response regulator